MTRELVFVCTFSSASGARLAHVRAWDLEEALDLYARELRGEGVAERGFLHARSMRGGESRRSRYRSGPPGATRSVG